MDSDLFQCQPEMISSEKLYNSLIPLAWAVSANSSYASS